MCTRRCGIAILTLLTMLIAAVVLAQQPKKSEQQFTGKINFTIKEEVKEQPKGEPKKEETTQKKIVRIAREKQVEPEIVLAIAEQESGYDPNAEAITPYEESYGLYQINLLAHPEVTIEQAKDVEFSTRWTIDNLIGHDYPDDTFNAVARHNGSGPKAIAYARKVMERAGRIKAEIENEK